jgi:hypothetical protein
MDQSEARRRAREYARLGFVAVARTEGGWPKPDEKWHVAIKAANNEFYQEYDIRVTRARDAYVKQFVRKPDVRCRCGYDPTTQQDFDDHIEAASRLDDGKDHG